MLKRCVEWRVKAGRHRRALDRNGVFRAAVSVSAKAVRGLGGNWWKEEKGK